MFAINRCPVCGNPLSPNPLGAACAYCLLQLGVSDSPPAAGVADDPAPGQFVRQGVLPVFGDYELISEIARGGMGVVYRARQISLNRTVAVKLILAGQLATPEAVRRFQREAQAAAGLHHPGIVPIYEIGEVETQHFFSMELIDNASLAECLDLLRLKPGIPADDRRRQEASIAELIGRVARALAFAHQRGVLHRDIKPSNILMDENGHPRLTDFGLARLNADLIHTVEGSVLGTPGYLAPELAGGSDAGRAGEVTTAVDIYSLGATLYELLTGRPPFVGKSAVATMILALQQPPEPPRKVNPSVHRDLETIALRCLEKEPQQRYHSAEAVADELERFLRGEPIHARPISQGERFVRWCRRNRALSAVLFLLLITISAGSGAALLQSRRVRRANVELSQTIDDMRWVTIQDMLRQGQSSNALATVASVIRQHPDDAGAATFAMSLLQNRRFPLPAAPQIRHPGGAALSVSRISPDATRIVTASFDGTARIWDAKTSLEIAPPLKHEAAVNWIEFSPDGKTLATGSDDKTARLWDARTGKPRCPPIVHDQPLSHVRFSPDGKYLLTQTANTIRVLDGITGQTLAGPLVRPGRIMAARFVQNDTVFTAESNAGQSGVCLWDARSGTQLSWLGVPPMKDADINSSATRVVIVQDNFNTWVADFPSGNHKLELAPNGLILGAAFSPQGDRIALRSISHWARVYDAQTAIAVTAELPHYYVLDGLRFFDDGHRLLTWGSDSLAQSWNIDANTSDCEPMRHAHRVAYAEPSTIDGKESFLTTETHSRDYQKNARTVDEGTGAAQLWSVTERGSSDDRFFGALFPAFDAARLSPDGRFVALGGYDDTPGNGQIHVLDTRSGLAVCPPLIVKQGAWGLMYTPDSSRLVSTSPVGQVTIWSVPGGLPIVPPVTVPEKIHPAEMAADGDTFATGATDGTVRLWSTATGQPIRQFKHGANVRSLAFSPDASLLASAGGDHITRIWNTTDGKLLRELVGHQNEVMSVFFSPDGKKVITGSLDFTARVWDTSTGKTLAVLPHRGEVLDVAFSPDKRYVATASRDCTAVIWDAATGVAHARPLLHDKAVRNVRFSPDGRQLLTLDFDGLQSWDVATGHPLTVHLPHPMTGGTGFQSSSLRFDFTADGHTVLVAGDSFSAQLWHLPHPPSDAPPWFPQLLEAIAGQQIDPASGRPDRVPAQSFLNLSADLKKSTSVDYYTTWARHWLGSENSK